MLEHYFRGRKKLTAMRRNLLAPFLEEAAARYRAEGYFFGYARRSLTHAASFGVWLRKRRVPLDRITS